MCGINCGWLWKLSLCAISRGKYNHSRTFVDAIERKNLGTDHVIGWNALRPCQSNENIYSSNSVELFWEHLILFLWLTLNQLHEGESRAPTSFVLHYWTYASLKWNTLIGTYTFYIVCSWILAPVLFILMRRAPRYWLRFDERSFAKCMI